MPYLWLVLALISNVSVAAGPEKVATIERQLWPETISNQAAFDRASAHEIRHFARVIAQTPLTTKADIQQFIGIEEVNTAGVQQWLTQTQQRLVANYQHACPRCATSWNELATNNQALDAAFQPWALASEKFYQRYLYEQVRLAALFPRISSEITSFSSQELTGFEFNDGEFLLTFDDGPSPKRTAPLISALTERHIKAFFFVLGEQLQSVSSKPPHYQQQCLGSHGYTHTSHQTMANWADSLDKSRQQLAPYQQGPYWFRPPYGQRTTNLLANLTAHHEKTMLWNIDSQDWNNKLSDQQVEDRVITLMLLWRRGIILYHDIHPRALHNLNHLQQLISDTDNRWLDCHTLTLKSDE